MNINANSYHEKWYPQYFGPNYLSIIILKKKSGNLSHLKGIILHDNKKEIEVINPKIFSIEIITPSKVLEISPEDTTNTIAK